MSPESGFPLDASISAAMGAALSQAEAAGAVGEIPVGAVLLNEQGELVASAHNACRGDVVDVTAHAEMVVLRHASAMSRRGTLEGHTLVVTLEPCAMCAGAISAARIARVVFGAWDENAGAAASVFELLRDRRLPHRGEDLGGVEEAASQQLLRAFFDERRV
jgi:tRNA(adenine34) deaminase